ncbi:hypothetical protein [Paenibacillus sp. L3-i20]|uniref:hypothetical protein n=1 Tax=Paenibacillus sp. L3-i20 TaxID=2905833 RepID=UPI001EDD7646|nr:hypothetical protein [Paenibacillus sp. L3-i20]GKU80171.1 hypothetical protein L3i20_v245680 [Paenibacillus sp. L3-i20]
MSKLFDGISEPRFVATHGFSVEEAARIGQRELEEWVKNDIAHSLVEAFQNSSKISLTKEMVSSGIYSMGTFEFRSEMYVFTLDELKQLIANVRREEQERFIPRK